MRDQNKAREIVILLAAQCGADLVELDKFDVEY